MDTSNGVPEVAKGAKGTDVSRVQHLLSANGFMDAGNPANFDGQFGSGTEGAVKKFQSAKGLGADGRVGQEYLDQTSQWLMFKGRSVTDILVLTFTFVVCFSILATGGTIAILEIKDPGTDTAQITDTLSSLVAGMMGALLGLIAGKSEATQQPPPPQPPPDETKTP